MPHTNRKKKGPATSKSQGKKPQNNLHAPTKRILVDDEEGWTHVIDTPQSGRRNRGGDTSSKEGKVIHAGDWEGDGVAYINMTLDDMKREYAYWEKNWVEGDGYEALRDMLLAGEEAEKELKARKQRAPIDNAVCLGLGSLQRASREGSRNSFLQLAALVSILRWLDSSKSMPCIFQDPQFTDIDKEFLSSMGYEVVDDPEAFEHIGGKTLVYAIHCYESVYKTLSRGPKPGLLVGTDIDKFGMFNTSPEAVETAKALEEMVRDCEVLDMPQHGVSFSDTKLYWRKSDCSVP